MISGTTISGGADAADEAAQRLRLGQVVAVPTETVYGLAADATNANAVASIFAIKGRPQNNPLITHVLSIGDARRLTGAWPESAEILAAAFWPGPLTMVLSSAGQVAAAVSAGLPTIGVRVPSHPMMRAILAKSELPLAAPSANQSGHVSPTTPRHVLADLNGCIDLIVDGGPCAIGIESTVAGFHGEQPVIFRPGIITAEDIDQALRRAGVNLSPTPIFVAAESNTLPSPGMLSRHYAPDRPTYLFLRSAMHQLVNLFTSTSRSERMGVISFGSLPDRLLNAEVITLPADLYHATGGLYSAMRQLDRPEISAIFIELPGGDQLSAAGIGADTEPKDHHITRLSGMARVLADRLSRAALPWPKVRP